MAQVNTKWLDIEEEDENMIIQLAEPAARQAFLDDLESQIPQIEEIVAHHLHLKGDQKCDVSGAADWIYGSFNVCVPISVRHLRRRVMLRCPFPFMLGKSSDSYDVDLATEKIRCEAATYAWIDENCALVPIPHLWGFGLPNGVRFTPVIHTSWFSRFIESFKDLWAWLRCKRRHVPFVRCIAASSLRSGYLLTDFVEDGTMLSTMGLPSSSQHKRNLYTSLSRVMLNMARHPLKAIGTFRIDDNGEMSLQNRPLTKHLSLLERQGIPSMIPQDNIYLQTDCYVNDLLRCLDLRLEFQPNAIRDSDDADAQMAVCTMLRAVMRHFVQDDLRRGPFVMNFTDLHESNLFVDHEYNVTSVIDLEWCCSLPIELLHPPFWLTGLHVDEFESEGNKKKLHREWRDFIDLLEEEERITDSINSCSLSKTMRKSLAASTHWYMACLMLPRATYNIFLDHIQPTFAQEHLDNDELSISFQQITAKYWRPGSNLFVERKLEDRQLYLQQLRSRYSPSSEN